MGDACERSHASCGAQLPKRCVPPHVRRAEDKRRHLEVPHRQSDVYAWWCSCCCKGGECSIINIKCRPGGSQGCSAGIQSHPTSHRADGGIRSEHGSEWWCWCSASAGCATQADDAACSQA